MLDSQEMSDLYVARKVNAITCLQVVITRVISSRNVPSCRRGTAVSPSRHGHNLRELRDDSQVIPTLTILTTLRERVVNIIHYCIPINVLTGQLARSSTAILSDSKNRQFVTNSKVQVLKPKLIRKRVGSFWKTVTHNVGIWPNQDCSLRTSTFIFRHCSKRKDNLTVCYTIF